MLRHFVLAVLVLLLVPGIAQAHKKATRKTHHRTARVAASQRTAKNNLADTNKAQDAEPASNPVPLSWLLIILTSTVAVAFVAFMGMCFNVESPSSQVRLAHTSRP